MRTLEEQVLITALEDGEEDTVLIGLVGMMLPGERATLLQAMLRIERAMMTLEEREAEESTKGE